jgi:hypothetical protein
MATKLEAFEEWHIRKTKGNQDKRQAKKEEDK